MAGNVALELIAEVMRWDEDNASPSAAEFVWLRMMSAIKYDGYAAHAADVLRTFEGIERT